MKWLPLTWIDPRYEVNEAGQVRSFANSHGGTAKKPRVLKPNTTNSGYLQARLPSETGGFKWYLLHRLVLRAFTGVVGEQCNHKDGARTNNALSNLEWCSQSENRKHALTVLNCRKREGNYGLVGIKNKLRKSVKQCTPDGKVVKVWDAIADAARCGFSQGNIAMVCSGQRKHHKGFVWSFI